MPQWLHKFITPTVWASFFNNPYFNQTWINRNFFFFSRTNLQRTFSFNFIDLYKSLFLLASWNKARVLYYVNNWVYTTNHKRIAVNYFWFVILSGIFGMVLATVIRLELAYPGVGIFAGDSLQYLSLVTAHGVIMVFFMIMPLMFGAFANFLLPTQLGVHDVAFPRLNSAAFWFLPAGLIMLGQLICIDRRYQRMNCFNIREIQSLLKRRFFTDLINVHDQRNLLSPTVLALRYRLGDISSTYPNSYLFYNYGLQLNPRIRNASYITIDAPINNTLVRPSFTIQLFQYFSSSSVINFINQNILFFFKGFSYFFNISSYFKTLFFSLSAFFTTSPWTFFYALTSFVFKTLEQISKINFFFNKNLFLRFTDFSLSDFFFYLTALFSNFTNFHFNLQIFWFNSKEKLNFNYLINLFFQNLHVLVSYIFNTIINVLNLYTVYDFLWFPNITAAQTTTAAYFSDLTFTVYSFISRFPNDAYTTFQMYFNSYLHSQDEILANYRTLYFQLNDKISNPERHLENYFFQIFFFNAQSLSHVSEKTSTPDQQHYLNYNSYVVYFQIMLNLWYNIPLLLWNLFTSLFDFKRALFFINDFYLFVINWYIPLLLTDNFFGLHYWIPSSLFSRAHVFNVLPQHTLINYDSFRVSQAFLNIQLMWNIVYHLFSLLTHSFFCVLEQMMYFTLLFSDFFFQYKNYKIFNVFLNKLLYTHSTIFSNPTHTPFKSGYFSNNSLIDQLKYAQHERSDNPRYARFNNPLFKYDYKSGDYFPKLYKEVYGYLFTTINDLTSALRSSPWFFSNNYFESFTTNFTNYFTNIQQTNIVNTYNIHSWSSSRINNTDSFYNLFYTLNTDNGAILSRWLSINSLNQKFYKFFHTSSMQQRIYANWRQLKFTREAWRCKLLAARHQKTMYRRYIHEDGAFWSIERNAKDLLPGWAMITPFSSRTRFTAIGKTDIGLMGVLIVLNSSIVSAANFLVTYRYLSTLNNRKMRDARSFFTEGVMVSSWMMVAANPMLIIGIIMLLSDRHWQTSFFDYSGGGDTVLFQHMFWFFGHPEVYIILIPVFGFVNTLLSHFLKKRVSARASLMYSMYTIAFLGFFVWGHHMYMVGLAHTTRMLFSTLTVMISVPAATKLMHWCVTIANSAFTMELPFLCTLTFIFLFVSGGISGMCVAHTGMDILFHDTFYVIGHFHVMFAGAAMFGSFGAFYFYFPAIFGVKYSRLYAYLHYIYYLIGHLMTFVPMFWLGYAGMPRRILDYPSSLGGWHSIMSAGHMLSVAGLIAFFIMIFDSLRQARTATRNNFGIARFNTRVNFYIYEISRLLHVQRKGFYLFRFVKPMSIKLNGNNFKNFEYLETTLYSYTFHKK